MDDILPITDIDKLQNGVKTVKLFLNLGDAILVRFTDDSCIKLHIDYSGWDKGDECIELSNKLEDLDYVWLQYKTREEYDKERESYKIKQNDIAKQYRLEEYKRLYAEFGPLLKSGE